jgi:hypothetical protein
MLTGNFNMEKNNLYFIISLIFLSLICSYSSIFEKANAQTSQLNSITNDENMTKSVDIIPSFSTNGTISTLFYIVVNNTLLDSSDNRISISNITHGLNLAAKSIGDGNWTLDVNKGKVERFNANLSFINADGTQYHTHNLNNFTSNEIPQISSSPENTTSIKGKIDVGLNGETAWKQVNTTIIISKNKAITIVLDDKSTDNHFVQQPIYGKVKSFIG